MDFNIKLNLYHWYQICLKRKKWKGKKKRLVRSDGEDCLTITPKHRPRSGSGAQHPNAAHEQRRLHAPAEHLIQRLRWALIYSAHFIQTVGSTTARSWFHTVCGQNAKNRLYCKRLWNRYLNLISFWVRVTFSIFISKNFSFMIVWFIKLRYFFKNNTCTII